MHYSAWSHPFKGISAHPLASYNDYQANRDVPHFRQQFPEVNPALFRRSAKEYQQLMKAASAIVSKLADSESFAYKVMSAAQQSNTAEVKRLLTSAGVKEQIELDYNPDGINLKMASKVEQKTCCKLEMAIRWR